MQNPLPSAKTVLLLAVTLFFYGCGGNGTPAAVAADCSTSPRLVSPVSNRDAAAQTPAAVVVDPLNRFAYVAQPDGHTVSLYTIDADTGAFTHRQDLAAGPGRRAMAITQGATVVRYTPKFAYVTKKTRAPAPRSCAVAFSGGS